MALDYRVRLEGDLESSFRYTRKLVNRSSSEESAKTRAIGRYTTMNAYDTHLMEGKSSPSRVTAHRRFSYGATVQDLHPPPLHAWGIDITPADPVAIGFTYDPFENAMSEEVSDEAMAKLFASVRKKKESSLDLGLAIAELGQTWNLFASTAARINRSYRALRRGKVREAFQSLHANVSGLRDVRPRTNWTHTPDDPSLDAQALARWRDQHLQWTYGVMPLLNDVDSAAKKLASLLAHKPPVVRVSGQSSRTTTTNALLRPFIQGVQRECSTSLEEEVRVKHVVWYTVTDAMVSHAESLGLLNPLSLAWQTSPMTFVFDWMLDVGGWLRNLTAFFGLQFHSGCSSRSGHVTRTYYYGGMTKREFGSYSWYDDNGALQYAPFETYFEEITASSVVLKTGGFRRVVLEALPLPPLPRLTLPSDPGSALSKLVSAIELLHQRRNSSDFGSVPPIYRDIPVRRGHN